MMIRGFIFDLDGTLLDSMAIWDKIGENYLRKKGVEAIPPDLKKLLEPMSLLQAAEYFNKQFNFSQTAEQTAAEINTMIEDAYRYHIKLKDGVQRFLAANSNIKMCVATETDKYLAEYALRQLHIDRSFCFIITSAEVGGSKQSPVLYRRAAERLSLPVNEIAVFEDPHAVETSKKAGFFTVGVYEKTFEASMDKIRQSADCFVINLNEFRV